MNSVVYLTNGAAEKNERRPLLELDRLKDAESGISAHDCQNKIYLTAGSNYDRNKIIFATVLCFLFMVVEIVGGYLSNSLAIYTDASHMLTDIIGYCIQLLAMWIATFPQTPAMSFGWYRAEVIGAVLSVFTIWITTAILTYLAVLRIINRNYEIEPNVMLITASLGIMINVVLGAVLWMPEEIWRRRRSHGMANKGNINVRSAMVHVFGDLVQSMGVFVAALIIKFQPTWLLADPICTFLFAVIILITTFSILNDSLKILMNGLPTNVDRKQIVSDLKKIGGIKDIHSLHIWSLTTDKNVLSVHVTADKNVRSPTQILDSITEYIQQYNDSATDDKIYHFTVQVELHHLSTIDHGSVDIASGSVESYRSHSGSGSAEL